MGQRHIIVSFSCGSSIISPPIPLQTRPFRKTFKEDPGRVCRKVRNSGVMTFIVNQEGIIYQKDIGKETKRRAEAMKIFDPDKTWSKVEETVTQK